MRGEVRRQELQCLEQVEWTGHRMTEDPPVVGVAITLHREAPQQLVPLVPLGSQRVERTVSGWQHARRGCADANPTTQHRPHYHTADAIGEPSRPPGAGEDVAEVTEHHIFGAHEMFDDIER
jgi:hypothetical protein